MHTPKDVTILIRYPLEEGEIFLRTDADWESDLAPVDVSDDGLTTRFVLTLEEPFAYFKPILRRNGEMAWSRGENYLAIADATRTVEVYPHFFADTTCSVCQLQEHVAGEKGHTYRVFYPPGYAENHLRRYPVLYMQDGQNLFFPDEAFGGQHWRVQETLDLLSAMNALEQVIVVGVYPENRMVDYTWPGYEDYGRFVVEHLKPKIDAEYRTLTGPENTAVMGSSLGGVVSFYLAWRYPDVFGMAACMSSTFGYRDDLHERVENGSKPDVRFYLDSGWPRDNFEVTRDMRSLLASRGFREGLDLHYFAFPEALHNEASWAMRAHLPFQLFFGRRPGADVRAGAVP